MKFVKLVKEYVENLKKDSVYVAEIHVDPFVFNKLSKELREVYPNRMDKAPGYINPLTFRIRTKGVDLFIKQTFGMQTEEFYNLMYSKL